MIPQTNMLFPQPEQTQAVPATESEEMKKCLEEMVSEVF